MRNVIVSWSGGKDSCLACYKAINQGYNICYFMNTISQEYRRVRFHGVNEALIQAQVKAINIPFLQRETTGDGYEQEFKDILCEVIPNGIDGVVFGDIHLQHCLEWAERICAELSVKAIEPLWGQPSEEVLLEFINSGFEAIVVSTQANLLGKEWIGRSLDKEFLKDIKQYKNIDACGENGEYHTFVTNGPLFRQRINISESQKVLRGGYWFLDIREYALLSKD